MTVTIRAKLHTGMRFLLLLSVALLTLGGCVPVPWPPDEITQISTYPALEKGLYDGAVTYAQLAQRGNFGIGTFEGMNGEMVALDGTFYQVRSDGSVHAATGDMETPFATVAFFRAEQRTHTAGPLGTYDLLKAYLAQVAPQANRPYAIRVDGKFSYVKIRSIPGQSAPYPPLADVIARQVTWERRDISGTLVGYWFPQYLSALNAPGYHLHFIADDRQAAGHLLECSLDEATIGIDYVDRVTLQFPQTATFGAADFAAKP